MNALEAHRNLLRELDKFEAPTFTVKDFNYFFPSSIREYITENYVEFDVVQKDLDDLRAILAIGHPLTFTNGIAPLPGEYQHMLNLEVILKVKEDSRDHKADDTVTVYPKRLKTARKGFVQENSYQQESIEYSHYQMDKSNLYVYSGSNSTALTGAMDYLKIPELVYLNPDTSVDYNDPVNNTVLQFPDHVNYEIIKKCRQIFLENIESQRYASTLQENQLRKQEQ